MAKKARIAYEASVGSLAALAATMRAEGTSEEAIARDVVNRRNQIKVEFRKGDPPNLVAEMERINKAKYGHPVGPTADELFRKYGNWADVIAAACRPSRLSQMM